MAPDTLREFLDRAHARRQAEPANVPTALNLPDLDQVAEAVPVALVHVDQVAELSTPTRPRPVARAVAAAPCAGRSLWAVLVALCPVCGGSHLHRSARDPAELRGQMLRRCPAVGVRYRVRVRRIRKRVPGDGA